MTAVHAALQTDRRMIPRRRLLRVGIIARLAMLGFVALVLTSCQSTTANLTPFTHSTDELAQLSMAELLDRVAASPDSASNVRAGGQLVKRWRAEGLAASAKVGSWQVRFDGDYELRYFDELLPACDYDMHGLDHRHVRSGRGVALIGYRANKGRSPIEKWYPPEGITRPVSALFKVRPGNQITVSLVDSTRHTEAVADFSAPLAYLLGRTGELQRMGVGGLMGKTPSEMRGHWLYLMEPYDPEKIPVLFVHGLLSTPLAWADATNELWGDATFRSQYQVWHYLYPTSAPFLYSAKMLRQRVQETRMMLDPGQRHPASQRMEVVAHSMGGLITRTLVTDSGETAWDTVFRVPPQALKGSKEDIAEVTDILHWKARKDVKRIIFVAVPHRGSNMSGGLVGRIGDSLVGLPKNFTSLYARLNRDNPEALQPAFRDSLSKGKLSSIDTLSPKHPIFAIMNRLPFARDVEVHSIIGDRGKKGSLEQSSDGVVPYSSSHLDQAKSELVVPAGHGAYKHPYSVAEILRILGRG